MRRCRSLSQAADYDIGVYFEANGHGTVVFRAEAGALRARAP